MNSIITNTISDTFFSYYFNLNKFKEDTFKDSKMKDLYPKMMWSISNFVLNTNDINPVFKTMLLHFKENIKELQNPNSEDIDYILQTVYFLELMMKKHMISMYSSLDEIIPKKEINRFLKLKKEIMDQNLMYQKDLKLVVN